MWEWIASLKAPRVFFIYSHDLKRGRFSLGLKANTEISFWCYQAIKEAFPHVHFLRLQEEKGSLMRKIRPQDVVIGHIGETFLRASKRTRKLIAFYPWAGHEDRSTSTLFNCIPFEEEKKYWELAKSIILLTSEYNVREYIEKERNFWFPFYKKMRTEKKIRFVHQPLDLSLFPRIKTDYLTSHFLYIGNDAHMKCLPASKKLVEAVGRKLHLFGVGESRLDHLNLNQVKTLPALADFFIQPGMWEGSVSRY